MQPRFRKFYLTKKEWITIREMCHVIKPVSDVATFVSAQAYPTINSVTLSFNDLFGFLEKQAETAALPEIRLAAHAGLEVLRKYYAKTDRSPIFTLAVFLDPRERFQFFESPDWEAYAPEIWENIKEIYQRDYQSQKAVPGAPQDQNEGRRKRFAWSDPVVLYAKQKQRRLEDEDQLALYRDGDLSPGKTDPMDFWRRAIIVKLIELVLHALQTGSGASFIVFVTTIPQANAVYNKITTHMEELAPELVPLVDLTHSHNSPQYKAALAAKWGDSKLTLVYISTPHMELGMDRSNIRAVFTLSLPADVESKEQRDGRAGRDNLPAGCYLLYAEWDKKHGTKQFANDDIVQLVESTDVCIREKSALFYNRESNDSNAISLIESKPAGVKCCNRCRTVATSADGSNEQEFERFHVQQADHVTRESLHGAQLGVQKSTEAGAPPSTVLNVTPHIAKKLMKALRTHRLEIANCLPPLAKIYRLDTIWGLDILERVCGKGGAHNLTTVDELDNFVGMQVPYGNEMISCIRKTLMVVGDSAVIETRLAGNGGPSTVRLRPGQNPFAAMLASANMMKGESLVDIGRSVDIACRIPLQPVRPSAATPQRTPLSTLSRNISNRGKDLTRSISRNTK
ncbi:hypothetical protein HDU93_000639 [Gonapodya sp. JEL0774]|nr:hypothetical protein HDU93_000639 [Gonapodya sp. JEL0774]